MLKNYFKIITLCNIPDTIAIVFNKRLLMVYIYIYIIVVFIFCIF